MAPPPRVRALGRESIPGAPAWFDGFLQMFNESSAAAGNALSKRLTFRDNFLAEIKDITITAPSPTWTAPTFSNSWVNFGGSYGSVGYRIDTTGRVRMQGMMKSGTITAAAFTLPVGYRPATDKAFAASSNSAFALLNVKSTGVVSPDVGSNVSFSLEGVSFDATAPALPAVGADVALVKHGLPDLGGVLPVSVRAISGAPLLSAGGLSLDWEQTSGGIRIKAVWGLTPGQRYRLRLLIFAG